MIKYSTNITKEFEKSLMESVVNLISSAINKNKLYSPEWLSLMDAAKYAGVSYNTFIKFRHMGLKVCEINGIKRVSRKEIDRFLEENSF
ncbi:helix-turn-helix domain-containing protein [Lysinibacillus capsici]|uniref:helix-turn-helix domain-containing protein n=1 Tax=Lysinibacillus capsici TaxID=2115968 RepID=UPI003F268A08